MTKAYPIAANEVVDETLISRSRFICYLFPCESSEQAKAQVKAIQQLHAQATHHCYAFVTGAADDSQHYGFSDDGEPTGTAGRPMLAVLQGGGIGQLCAIVVRYFGGVKLGTGGLQRAYSSSVRQAMSLLQTKIKIPMVHKSLACQYTQVNDVTRIIEQAGGTVVSQEYTEQAYFTFNIPNAFVEQVQQQLLTFSAGQLVFVSAADDECTSATFTEKK